MLHGDILGCDVTMLARECLNKLYIALGDKFWVDPNIVSFVDEGCVMSPLAESTMWVLSEQV